jgi:hypothetical protein
MKPRKPLPRSTKPIARRSKPKATNAYTRPEWRQLVAEVKKRSRGVCELQVACGGDPATGDPHHLSYASGRVVRRLLVPLDQLQAVCYTCHQQVHREES